MIFDPNIPRLNELLILRNFNNKNVIVSGGAALKLKWKKYKNVIWQPKIEQLVVVGDLIVNGKLQQMPPVQTMIQQHVYRAEHLPMLLVWDTRRIQGNLGNDIECSIFRFIQNVLY